MGEWLRGKGFGQFAQGIFASLEKADVPPGDCAPMVMAGCAVHEASGALGSLAYPWLSGAFGSLMVPSALR